MSEAKDERLAKYPKTAQFEVVDTIGVPHPYCITPKHVGWASDHWGGRLGKEAIRDSEKNGARCDICKGKLSYDEHETAILIEVRDNRELKAIPELKDFLLSIKEMTEKDKFVGWAFKQVK